MPNQCTRCGRIYPDTSKEILEGCNCGSRFFYYIRQEKFDELKSSSKKALLELEKSDIDQIEKDIRELTGIKKPEEPVILDLESVRVIEPGKFEIDLVNLFSRKRPIIYKLGEGKYIIDLASSLRTKEDYKTEKKSFIEEYEEEIEEEKDWGRGSEEDIQEEERELGEELEKVKKKKEEEIEEDEDGKEDEDEEEIEDDEKVKNDKSKERGKDKKINKDKEINKENDDEMVLE